MRFYSCTLELLCNCPIVFRFELNSCRQEPLFKSDLDVRYDISTLTTDGELAIQNNDSFWNTK